MKKILAILVGKIIIFLSPFLKLGGGTSAPGKITLKIYPKLLKDSRKIFKKGVILITGTNGKTTTTKLLVEILKTAGFSVIYNSGGSNLPRGIISAILKKQPLLGKAEVDFGVFEVDEAYLEQVIKNLNPSLVILGNLFRDQLDRYGEIDILAQKWEKALKFLPKNSFVLANSDDPTITSFAEKFHNVKFFGVENLQTFKTNPEHIADTIYCKKCFIPLRYSKIFFSHIGKYFCPNCSFKNPKIDFIFKNPQLDKGKIKGKICFQNKCFPIAVNLEGTYNFYNLIAAVSAAFLLKIESQVIKKGLENFSAAFGRQEEIFYKNRKIKIILVKNPTGFNQALGLLKNSEKVHSILFLLNDNIADGKDVSWIWDVDFESLPHNFELFFGGRRAYDMALRLKYAGQIIKKENISTNIKAIFEKAVSKTSPSNTIFIFPSYTALLDLRNYLQKILPIKKFWEE